MTKEKIVKQKVMRCKKHMKPVFSSETCPDWDSKKLPNGKSIFYTRECNYCFHCG